MAVQTGCVCVFFAHQNMADSFSADRANVLPAVINRNIAIKTIRPLKL